MADSNVSHVIHIAATPAVVGCTYQYRRTEEVLEKHPIGTGCWFNGGGDLGFRAAFMAR